MKLLVTGYGRHGKDTLCELLGIPFVSSSFFLLDKVIWPLWGHERYNSKEDCYKDRINNRKVWFDLITAFNATDKARLTRSILAESDIYCGLRNKEELEAANKESLFDLKIWVDASQRLPKEDDSSCTVTPDMCDLIVDNNGTLKDLKRFAEEFKASYLDTWGV